MTATTASSIAERRLVALAQTRRFDHTPSVNSPVANTALLRALSFTPPADWSDAQCAAMRTVDPAALAQSALLDYVEAVERQKAHLDARQMRALAILDRRDRSGMHVVREEVACVLRIAPLSAAKRLAQARALTDHLPLTLAALAAGDLSLPHTHGLCSMAVRVDPLVAAQSKRPC